MSKDTELAAYERELLHVLGNYPDDKQRIKDIEAEIAKRKRSTKKETATAKPKVEHAVAVEK